MQIFEIFDKLGEIKVNGFYPALTLSRHKTTSNRIDYKTVTSARIKLPGRDIMLPAFEHEVIDEDRNKACLDLFLKYYDYLEENHLTNKEADVLKLKAFSEHIKPEEYLELIVKIRNEN